MSADLDRHAWSRPEPEQVAPGVLRVPLPGAEGRRMRQGLLPGPDARRVGPTFTDWLSSR